MGEEFFEGYRLSPQQERLWSLSSAADASVYCAQCAALIEGHLDSGLLQMAVDRVIARHEILRTDFRSVATLSLPAQVISGSASVAVEEIDIAALGEQEQATEFEVLYESSRLAEVECLHCSALNVTSIRVEVDRQILILRTGSLRSDRRGLKNIIREVIGECQGETRKNDQVAQYADVSEIFNKLLDSEETKAGRDFWQSRASRNVGEVRLATKREAKGAFKPKVERRVAEEELSEGLKSLSESIGAGEGAVLLSVFGVMISRMSGKGAVRVGVGYDGRTFEELREAVGVYMRYLPIDFDVDDKAFSELAKSVDESSHKLSGWQNYFDWKRFFSPTGSGGESGYFMYLFEYEVEPQEYSSGAIIYRIERLYACIDRFEVKLFCCRKGGDLSLELHYDSSIYDPSDINRFADHYMTLLRDAVRSPRRSSRRLYILSAQQREMILNEFNRTRREYDTSRCIHELLREQAERSPERIALIGEGQALSYRELNRRSNRIAKYLQGFGVGPEVVVGVCLERSIEMVVALLGVLKAGGSYLPLDSGYPWERLIYMLEDAGAGVVLTERKLEDRLPGYCVQTICLDVEWERINRESEKEPQSNVVAENLAYAIYTSGSTGSPKSVMLSHKGLCNLVEAQKEAFGLGDQSRVLQFASLSFDASVSEIFSTLAAGGSLHVYRQDSLIPGDDLVSVLRKDQITIVTLPPTALAVMKPEKLSNLQTVIAAGETCTAEIVERWARGRRFLNAYGPTEATVCASIGECEPGSHRKPNIGGPIANNQLYILDEEMRPAPVGVRGELYISGVGLARGYLGRPELTAERFVPNPFGREAGKRLYRTGDVVSYLFDGKIEFIGRADRQVKVRGYRIELGEIEATLNKHRDVQEAVALVREYEPGDKRLVAYVVPREPLALTSADLRDFVTQELPEHMTPSRFHFMAKMPLSKNGKIDRRLLSTVEVETESPHADEEPRSGAERLLAKIWSEALRIRHVGLDQNFFDLGGHSLLIPVIRLAVKERLRCDLSFVDFFAYPTVRSLARRIEQTDERTPNISESASRSARQKEYLQRRRESSKKE